MGVWVGVCESEGVKRAQHRIASTNQHVTKMSTKKTECPTACAGWHTTEKCTCHKPARAGGGALLVIMPIIGPRETHDYREFNLGVPGPTYPPPRSK